KAPSGSAPPSSGSGSGSGCCTGRTNPARRASMPSGSAGAVPPSSPSSACSSSWSRGPCGRRSAGGRRSLTRQPAPGDQTSGARGYVLGSLGCLGAFLAGFVAVAGVLPVSLGFAPWWAWFVAGFCGLALVGFAATHVPLLVHGGTYRVVVQDGRLYVDSPHRR